MLNTSFFLVFFVVFFAFDDDDDEFAPRRRKNEEEEEGKEVVVKLVVLRMLFCSTKVRWLRAPFIIVVKVDAQQSVTVVWGKSNPNLSTLISDASHVKVNG